MDKKNLTILILIALLIVAVGYIAIEKINFCEQAKNDSYAIGFNQGRESWNIEVIKEVNNNGKIPYWYNQSRYELNIAQLCGVQNG